MTMILFKFGGFSESTCEHLMRETGIIFPGKTLEKGLKLYFPDEEAIDWIDILSEDESIIYGFVQEPEDSSLLFNEDPEDVTI